MNIINSFLAPFKGSKKSVIVVSIIVGVLFGKGISWFIVNGIMPHIGVLDGGADFTNMKIIVNEEKVNDLGDITPAVVLNIGNLFQRGIDIIFIGFSIFSCMKLFKSFTKNMINNNVENLEEAIAIPIATEEEKFIRHVKMDYEEYNVVESK